MGNRLGNLRYAALSALVACGGSNKAPSEPNDTSVFGGKNEIPRVDASLCQTAGKKVATFDLNQDNQPDVWKLLKTVEEGGTTIELLTCKQVDLDHDGRKDYVIMYGNRGAKLSEEFDFDYDGRFDARHFFDEKTGEIYLVERDSNHDKQPDIWEKYTEKGELESVKRDRNGDGKPDVWEQYNAGTLMTILYDDDFDARVDRKDEVAKPKPPPPAADENTPGAPPTTDDASSTEDSATSDDDNAGGSL